MSPALPRFGVHNVVPIDREKVLQAAQKFVEKGRFDKAIVEYQRIVEEDPHDARILLKIGDLQSRTKTFEAAIGTYERVGRHYASQGFAVKAVAVYKQIREIIRKHVPKLADQYGHILPQLARQYQTLGLTGDALAAYDEYATHLHRAGREREATEVFRTIVDINGTNPLARLRLAEALLRQGETDAAVVEFSIAGDTLVGMGRGDDALKVFERILYERPDPELARRTAQMYLQRGQTDDGMMALAKLQIAFQADTRDLDTLDLLARAFSAIGQRPKAFEVRKEIVRVAREKGNISLAKKTIEELVAEAPHDEVVRAMANSVFARDHGSKAGSLPAPPATASSKMAPRSALHPAAASGALASVEAGVSALPPRDSFEVEPSEVSIEIEIPESIPPIPLGRDAIPRSIRHVVVDESMEVAEDMSAPQPFDAASHAQSVIENANAFRKHRIYSKAIETLQIGLELNPASLSLHQALKSTLVEAGYGDHAVSELFTIASIQLDALDDTGAEQALSEVLQLDPSNNRARHMLIALGYEPPPAPDPSAPARGSVVAEGQRPGDRYPPASGALQANEPLPSYDLEEINPSYAMSQIPPVAREALPSLLTTDDPFGSVDAPSTDDPSFAGEEMGAQRHRLPSFSLHDDDLGGPRLIPMAEEAEEEVSVGLDAYDELADAGPEEQPGLELTQATPLAGTRGFQGGDSLEDALDEAEFFTSRGLFEDAMAIVEELVPKFPNHPLLLERIREIHDAASAASGSSGEHPALHLAEPFAEDTEDRAFDIAAALDTFDGATVGPAPSAAASFGGTVDVEEVFAKFKEGVKAQVSESDSATHYDLGVAYKEMGLHRDAVAEFEMAARDPTRECVCYSMIGMVHMELGELDDAVDGFIRGLHSEHKTPAQENALYFELGNIYESHRNVPEALYYFEKVARRDPGFRDVAERLRTLKGSAVHARQNVAGEDDFERAFDDLFSGSKQ